MKVSLPLLAILVFFLVGCTGDTSVSKQPTQDEIQEGINRRIKAIDDDPNMTPQAKELAKSRITGSSAPSAGR